MTIQYIKDEIKSRMDIVAMERDSSLDDCMKEFYSGQFTALRNLLAYIKCDEEMEKRERKTK